ncbi:MAG TPA: hypothetical protein VHX60_09240 [Acidobacteriaceae bacterium]|jgi:hypothetical protein|nr:hypothetical protein [Acidobacteriaceae bacterium]
MRPVAESLELSSTCLAGTRPAVDVQLDEYIRLLGYPRGHVLAGRALELADQARSWYAEHGRPWFYARQAESLDLNGDAICIDGAPFSGTRLQASLRQAEAHSVILVAVGAGPEAEEQAARLWTDEKPDEYFFLEMYASAVVENLTTLTGARLCGWAESHEMAVLPHDSPGYSEWDVAEQPQLLQLIQSTRHAPFPSHVDVLDSGMLRPRKTQLAVFGLTRHAHQLRRLTDLIPCERCSFGPCQYRRVPYRRAPRPAGEQFPARPPVLDSDAAYTVNRKALDRWASERLSLRENPDGSLDAVFRYDGTTCTNMGRPLAFDYTVRLGPRDAGYPVREQHCAPAPNGSGHTHMCQYLEDPDRLMSAIDTEKPLAGEHLNAILAWKREPSAAGCFCESASRNHKWGLVLETLHYALVQREGAQDTDLT